MATTTNYGWTTPDDTALVKDGASAIRTLGTSVDTTTKNLNPQTTLGDIAYRSSTSNVNTRLALGTAGQVLTVNSGANAPEWAAVAAGGMTLINSGGTTLTGSSIVIGSIPQTYVNLQLVVMNYKPATDGDYLLLRFNGSSATNYGHGYGTGDTSNIAIVGTAIRLSNQSDNSVANGMCTITIPSYASALSAKIGTLTGVTNNQTTTANYNFYWTQWQFKDTTAITSITLLNDTGGNFTSGTAYLYGVK